MVFSWQLPALSSRTPTHAPHHSQHHAAAHDPDPSCARTCSGRLDARGSVEARRDRAELPGRISACRRRLRPALPCGTGDTRARDANARDQRRLPRPRGPPPLWSQAAPRGDGGADAGGAAAHAAVDARGGAQARAPRQ
eukprot:4794273-Prymnesium_polylepis.1